MIKKVISVIVSSLFIINFSITRVFASELDNLTSTDLHNTMNTSDFSMDFVMEEGNMTMNEGYEAMEYADNTNFMNHELDNSMDFFFDNLDSYQLSNDTALEYSSNDNIENAFQDGAWSMSFNDTFNNDTGMPLENLNFEGSSSSSQDESMPLESGSITSDNNNLGDAELNHVEANTIDTDLDNNSPQDATDALSSQELLQEQEQLAEEEKQKEEEKEEKAKEEKEKEKEEKAKEKEEDSSSSDNKSDSSSSSSNNSSSDDKSND